MPTIAARLTQPIQRCSRPTASSARGVFAGDEGFHKWTWAGITIDGDSSESHGCDYYLILDGKIAVKNTFRKA